MNKDQNKASKTRTGTISAKFVRETKTSIYLNINGNYDSWSLAECSYNFTTEKLTAPAKLLQERFPSLTF